MDYNGPIGIFEDYEGVDNMKTINLGTAKTKQELIKLLKPFESDITFNQITIFYISGNEEAKLKI